MKLISSLEYHQFDTSKPDLHQHDLNRNAYQFWFTQWVETFRELKVSKALSSDDYMKKRLGGLFYERQPVGFILYDQHDFSLPPVRDLNYFHAYPEKVKEHIFEWSEPVFFISYLTLSPEWRKSVTDLPVSEILVGLSMLAFLESGCKKLLTYSRNDRKVNGIVERHGGEAIVRGASANNVEVDFFEIDRSRARLSDTPGCKEAIMKLWNNHKKGVQSEINRQSHLRSVTEPYVESHARSAVGDAELL